MPRKKTENKEAEVPVKPLSGVELTRAALNGTVSEFVLGDRTFKIADLPYRDYLAFVRYLAPLFDAAGSQMVSAKLGITVPGLDFGPGISASGILDACSDVLPNMVQIICRQTDPTITVDDVMDLAKRPTALVGPVIAQIVQNKMIEDFSNFFGLLNTLLSPK